MQPLRTLPDVLAHLQALEATTRPDDGALAPFATTYLRMTQAVEAALGDGTFRRPDAVAYLDVVFAWHFLRIVPAPEQAPRCWQILLDLGEPATVHPVRRALAGMNAHINHDLALAVVHAADATGVDLADDADWYADFLAINTVIARSFEVVQAELVAGALARVDAALGPVDDALALWSIERARDAAWVRAQLLWRLRGAPPLRDAYLASHDRTIALIGRALLLR